MNDRDAKAKEIARRSWKASAKIYGTMIDEGQVDRLFETWWRRNGGDTLNQVYARN